MKKNTVLFLLSVILFISCAKKDPSGPDTLLPTAVITPAITVLSATPTRTATPALTASNTPTATMTFTVTATMTATKIVWVADTFESGTAGSAWDAYGDANVTAGYSVVTGQANSGGGTYALRELLMFTGTPVTRYYGFLMRTIDASHRDFSAYKTMSFDMKSEFTGSGSYYFVYINISDNSGNYYCDCLAISPFINTSLTSSTTPPAVIPWQTYTLQLDSSNFVLHAGTKTLAQLLSGVYHVDFTVELQGGASTIEIYLDNLRFSE